MWTPYLINWKLGLHSDAAVTALMARRILHGEHFIYFWGQQYMGAVEAYAGAALMTLLRADHPVIVELVPLLTYVAGSAILLKTCPPRERLARAFLLFAASPALYVVIVRPAVTQGTPLWLGWALLVALEPGLRRDPLSWRAFARAALAGVVLAVTTFWTSTGTLGLLALGAVVLLVVASELRSAHVRRSRRALARIAQLGLVFCVGQLWKLPIWLGWARSSPLTDVDIGGAPGRLAILEQAFLQFSPLSLMGRSTAGAYYYYSGLHLAWPIRPEAGNVNATWLTALVAVLLALGILAGVRAVFEQAQSALRSKQRLDHHSLYWCLLLFGCLGAFLTFRGVVKIGTARYLVFLFFPMVTLLGKVASRWSPLMKATTAGAWLVMVLVGHLQMLPLEDSINADIDRSTQYVLDRGIDTAAGDYWLSYSIAARTRERLVVAPFKTNRYPPYARRLSSRSKAAVFEFSARAQRGDRLMLSPEAWTPVEQRLEGEILVTLYRRRRGSRE